jgi:hypothetical protein
MGVMLLVSVFCSDPDCLNDEELWADSLDELVDAACECGCTFEVSAVSEASEARIRFRALPGGGADADPARSRRAA